MLFSLRRWRPRHLLASWLTYWVGLAAVTLGPAIAAIIRATSAEGGGGNINASLGSKGVTLNVLLHDIPLWAGTASLLKLVLLIAGPPIALWVAWLVRRPARVPGALSDAEEARVLREPSPEPGLVARTPDRAQRRPEA